MHVSFVECFVDPKTGEPLTLEATHRRGDFVDDGVLRSPSHSYRIVRGVPRFVPFDDNYSMSFGYQWHKWPRVQFESENVGKPMEGHTRRMWERITGVDDAAVKGALVVDMGCGAGRFVDVARSKGARVIGIDFSHAVDVAQQSFRDAPDVCICQGDALHLPVKAGVADGAFSIGVLHHTPDPRGGVREAARILRPGGWFSMAVYEKGGFYDRPMVQFWRRVFKALWPYLGHRPPLVYSHVVVSLLQPLAATAPPLAAAAGRVLPFANLPDRTWALLDTFDSVTPSYQSAHEGPEVEGWLASEGFRAVRGTGWGATSYAGVKPGAVACPA